jgi:hypothetical protein
MGLKCGDFCDDLKTRSSAENFSANVGPATRTSKLVPTPAATRLVPSPFRVPFVLAIENLSKSRDFTYLPVVWPLKSTTANQQHLGLCLENPLNTRGAPCECCRDAVVIGKSLLSLRIV